tara:strand:+ start:392 stop:2209 length:1818 start_codon:yes stop_codon:yes gene_type:complete
MLILTPNFKNRTKSLGLFSDIYEQKLTLKDLFLMVKGEHPKWLNEGLVQYGPAGVERIWYQRRLPPDKWRVKGVDDDVPNKILYDMFTGCSESLDYHLLAVEDIWDDLCFEKNRLTTIIDKGSGDVDDIIIAEKETINAKFNIIEGLRKKSIKWLITDGQGRTFQIIIPFFESEWAYTGKDIQLENKHGKPTKFGQSNPLLYCQMNDELREYIDNIPLSVKCGQNFNADEASTHVIGLNSSQPFTEWGKTMLNISTTAVRAYAMVKEPSIHNFVESGKLTNGLFTRKYNGGLFSYYDKGEALLFVKLAFICKYGFKPEISEVQKEMLNAGSTAIPRESHWARIKTILRDMCNALGHDKTGTKPLKGLTHPAIENYLLYRNFCEDGVSVPALAHNSDTLKYMTFPQFIINQPNNFWAEFYSTHQLLRNYLREDEGKGYHKKIKNPNYDSTKKGSKQFLQNPNSFDYACSHDTKQDFVNRISYLNDFIMDTPESQKREVNGKKVTIFEKWITKGIIIETKDNNVTADEKYEIISSSHPEPGMAKDMINGREFNHILEGEDVHLHHQYTSEGGKLKSKGGGKESMVPSKKDPNMKQRNFTSEREPEMS